LKKFEKANTIKLPSYIFLTFSWYHNTICAKPLNSVTKKIPREKHVWWTILY